MSTLVYLDIAIGSRPCGRLVFRLFTDVTPKAAENFRGLCTGEYGVGRGSGKPLCYRGCRFFRNIPGMLLQSGDIVNNDGSGGESIWGAPFADENFTRRHAQAGCLAMANNGRHTNASQFYITVKKAPSLDNRHVVIGQLTEGMETLRAMQLVPIDQQSQIPKANIVVTGCGALGSPAALRNAPLNAMRRQVESLMEKHVKELQKQRQSTNGLRGSDDEISSSDSSSGEEDAAKRRRKLRQARKQARFLESAMYKAQNMLNSIASDKCGLQQQSELPAGTVGAYDDESDSISGDEPNEGERHPPGEAVEDPLGMMLRQLEQPTAGSDSGSAASRVEAQKLHELRMKLTQGRKLNNMEVLEEKRREANPALVKHANANATRAAFKQLNTSELYRVYEEDVVNGTAGKGRERISHGGEETKPLSPTLRTAILPASDDSSGDEKGRRGGRRYLNEPAGIAEERSRCNDKSSEKNFGWNVFNEDALYRAHKKRLGEVTFRESEYHEQRNNLGSAFYDHTASLGYEAHEPSEQSKNRLVESVTNAIKRRQKFSRRRTFDEDEDVSYINERNRVYNKKLERSFKMQTLEIRQNLERGTAL